MTIRRLPQVAVTLGTLVAPLAALAQVRDGGVTTAPLPTAPVMGIPVLVLLAVVLASVAAYLLRRSLAKATAVVGFVAALTALAGVGYGAITSVTLMVQGAQCAGQTTQMFDPTNPTSLVNECPNPIQIISIQLGTCPLDRSGPLLIGPCTVGQVLANGETCNLPTCFV